MQPRVTVALATVWLTVAVLIGGAVTLHLSHDQYSPASPRRHAGIQRDHTRDWKDHDSAEDQPLDLWIGSRRSISKESEALSRNAKFTEQDFPLESRLKDIVSSKRIYPFSDSQRQLPNIVGAEFAADKVDYGHEMPETLLRETVISPSDLLDDPFVADDTFQDQGPGSMEIYKLDLSQEKTLLTATTPSTNLPSRNKSKAPKKTGHLNSKTKATEIKSTTTNTNVSNRQSNFFEEQPTETPLVNRNAFGVGGVPELQVGCEGLEASSSSSHKAKRSIDTLDKEKGEVPASVLLNVTPVSLNFDDVLSDGYDEEDDDMDELFRLRKLETAMERNRNRGDMDPSHLNSYHLDEFRQPEKLPERGDLGRSTQMSFSEFINGQKESFKRSLTDFEIKNYKEAKPKGEIVSLDDDDGTSRSHGRRLLWFPEANTEGFADGKSERKRARRSIDWGFGEDEGVVSSDELQTVNERRRQHEMRYHQNTSRRRNQHHGSNIDIDSIRQEYEKLLEQKQREEQEYLRLMQQANQRTLNRWEEEKKRRDEMHRRQYEEYRRRTDHTSVPHIDNEEIQQRQIEERQRQEAARNRMQEIDRRNEERLRRREEEERRRRLQEEELRRRPQIGRQEENLKRPDSRTSSVNDDEEKKRRLHHEEMRRQEEEQQRRLKEEEEEARRREQYRSQQEAQRRREEEARRQNLSEDDRRRLEDRRREWLENENERRRQQPPSNLMREEHPVNHPNDIRQHDQDEKRRQQEERQREQKLREYIARNQPINVNRADRRSEEERRRYQPEENRDLRMNTSRNDEEYRRRVEEQRKRQEEERKLQDYIRRNQPVNVPSRDNQSTAAGRNWFEERRLIEEARRRDSYSDPGARRVHGPSAPTYIDPRSLPEQVRQRQQEVERRLEERRQRYETEERRKELARRRWEEERRLQQEQMRKEAIRREEEARKAQSRKYEEDRKRLEIAKLESERRRQEMLKERSRYDVGRTRQPESWSSTYYQDPRLLAEYRRRQDSRPLPSNLMRTEEARRAAAERERQRLEIERRQQESRIREYGQKEIDQWRRQELARLNSLPVNARIIVHPGFSPTSPVSPVLSRGGFPTNEIDFTGINPNREGIQVAQFPVQQTPRPLAQTPSPCVWAVVHCCSTNNNRLVKCFESLGCPGINWDPDPCRGPIADAARTEILKFYANT